MSVSGAWLAGRTVDPQDVREAKAQLIDLLRTSRNQLPSGEDGWYRRIYKNDRVGVVATAQAIITLLRLKCTLEKSDQLVRTLISRQRPDGSWSFVSNLDDRGVVDATAWVVLALLRQQQHRETLEVSIAESVQNAVTWLVTNLNHDGGWGVCAGEKTRPYSTAVAVRALLAAPDTDFTIILRSLQSLVGLQDKATGAWPDAAGALSISATANVLLALHATKTDERWFQVSQRRAVDWLLQIARTSDYWVSGPYARSREEVEAGRASSRRRVTFESCPRAVVLEALLAMGYEQQPVVVHGFAEMLRSWLSHEWERATGAKESEPTSWMLYDVGAALASFEAAHMGGNYLIWAGPRRVVRHSPAEGILRRNLKRHRGKLGGGVAGIMSIPVLQFAGVIETMTAGAAIALAGVIGVNVLSNVLSDVLKQWNDRP